MLPSQTTIDTFPEIRLFSGDSRKLTVSDLATIEDLIAMGANADTCAVHLGFTVHGFKQAVKVSTRVQEAIKRGRTKDESEYRMALRNEALKMSNAALTIWHGKQAYGMSDKQSVSHDFVPNIRVHTGISTAQIEQGATIDHDSSGTQCDS